jgi:3-isopropylmalate/(R)-2-methylmalate dehydratase small subunit
LPIFFYNNCLKNGILPIVLEEQTVDTLFQAVEASPGYSLTIDLAAQTVTTQAGEHLTFAINANDKYRLHNGLDDIDLTLQQADEIVAYENRRKQKAPWLFQ